MNSKTRKVLTGLVAAAALTGGMLAATSASAYPYHHRNWDGGWAPGIAGFAAGALVGGALAGPDYGPDYGEGPYYDDGPYARSYAYGPRDYPEYCYRYKTFNPETGMYMSYNGPRSCP